MPGPTRLGSSTKRLILHTSLPSASIVVGSVLMTGVRKRDGMLGTDIFCKLGFDTTAAARPAPTAFTTVTGYIMAPDALLGLPKPSFTFFPFYDA